METFPSNQNLEALSWVRLHVCKALKTPRFVSLSPKDPIFLNKTNTPVFQGGGESPKDPYLFEKFSQFLNFQTLSPKVPPFLAKSGVLNQRPPLF